MNWPIRQKEPFFWRNLIHRGSAMSWWHVDFWGSKTILLRFIILRESELECFLKNGWNLTSKAYTKLIWGRRRRCLRLAIQIWVLANIQKHWVIRIGLNSIVPSESMQIMSSTSLGQSHWCALMAYSFLDLLRVSLEYVWVPESSIELGICHLKVQPAKSERWEQCRWTRLSCCLCFRCALSSRGISLVA